MKKTNLAGAIFGRWVVVSEAKRYGNHTHWSCRCVCGVTRTVEASSLVAGLSKSCGCLAAENAAKRLTKHQGNVAETHLIHVYKKSASVRGRLWALDRVTAHSLFISPCVYCGIKPSTRATSRKHEFWYNGIDRVNNELGYVSGNVVTCCIKCNRAKGTMSKSDFLTWLNQIANHVYGE